MGSRAVIGSFGIRSQDRIQSTICRKGMPACKMALRLANLHMWRPWLQVSSRMADVYSLVA